MEKAVPARVRLAAKRAFIRTTAHAYAATLSGGISATVIITVVTGQVDPLTFGVTVGVALVSPLLGGLASYASMIANGVPAEYRAAALDEGAGPA